MVRGVAILAVLLSVGFGCSDTSGPSLDGEQFIAISVNDSSWQLSSLSLGHRADTLVLGGWHASMAPGLYAFAIAVAQYHGPADYPLTGALHQELFADLTTAGHITVSYIIDPAQPGHLTIDDFRASDSTYVGSFAAELNRLVTDTATVPSHLSVHGSFRLRPGNTSPPPVPSVR